MLFTSFIINTKRKKYLFQSFNVITTSKLNNSIVFSHAIFWRPRAEDKGRGPRVEVDSTPHSWIFQKWLTAWIWYFLTFNIYYLGPFSQNFRSVSLFLLKLEPFCRGWFEKFCLVAKIQHFKNAGEKRISKKAGKKLIWPR